MLKKTSTLSESSVYTAPTSEVTFTSDTIDDEVPQWQLLWNKEKEELKQWKSELDDTVKDLKTTETSHYDEFTTMATQYYEERSAMKEQIAKQENQLTSLSTMATEIVQKLQ